MKKGIVGKKIGMTQIFTEETTATKRFRSVLTLTPRTAPRSW